MLAPHFQKILSRRKLSELPRVATPFLHNRIHNVLPDSEQLFAVMPHLCIKWLLYQRTSHFAVEKYKERRKTHRAPSTTYTKVWQVSVAWESWARGITLQNHLHQWPAWAHSSHARNSLHSSVPKAIADFHRARHPIPAECVYRCRLCTCFCPVDTCIDPCLRPTQIVDIFYKNMIMNIIKDPQVYTYCLPITQQLKCDNECN